MKHKLYWESVVFNPTGVATHHRGLLKELARKGVQVFAKDSYNSEFDKNGELLNSLYQPIDLKEDPSKVFTFFAYRPDMWQFKQDGTRIIGFPVHEGDKLPDGWAEVCNRLERIFVPSKATKNLFYSNGIKCPIHIIPEGVDIEAYTPNGEKADIQTGQDNPFIFLSVNSWTGEQNDRKGTDLLIRAFTEEFKPEENVALFLKISTFWMYPYNVKEKMQPLMKAGTKIPTIIADQRYMPEEEIVKIMRGCDCFVAPTMGESWGLTIGEAMACGLPIIVTRNPEAGYMDFVADYPLWIETEGKVQADERFFVKGNMMPKPSLESLKKQMRTIYEMDKEKRKELGLKGSEHIRNNFSWAKSADKMIEVLDYISEEQNA